MKTDKEGWEEHWEIANNQIKEGVNPYAYRLGFLDCSKQLEAKDKEIAELNVQAGKLKVENGLLENEIADLKAKLEAAEKELNDLLDGQGLTIKP